MLKIQACDFNLDLGVSCECAALDPSSFITPLSLGGRSYFVAVIVSAYVYFTVLQLFYPLAGYLADVRYGRYKCIVCSLWSFIAGSILFGISFVVAFALYLFIFFSGYWNYVFLSVTVIF